MPVAAQVLETPCRRGRHLVIRGSRRHRFNELRDSSNTAEKERGKSGRGSKERERGSGARPMSKGRTRDIKAPSQPAVQEQNGTVQENISYEASGEVGRLKGGGKMGRSGDEQLESRRRRRSALRGLERWRNGADGGEEENERLEKGSKRGNGSSSSRRSGSVRRLQGREGGAKMVQEEEEETEESARCG